MKRSTARPVRASGTTTDLGAMSGNVIPPNFMTSSRSSPAARTLRRYVAPTGLRRRAPDNPSNMGYGTATPISGRARPAQRPRHAAHVRHRCGRPTTRSTEDAYAVGNPRSTHRRRVQLHVGGRPGEALLGHGTKMLTIKGTIFIDGSATIVPDTAQVRRVGHDLPHGTFMMNNSILCVNLNGRHGCDTDAPWDPTLNGARDRRRRGSTTPAPATASTSRGELPGRGFSPTRTSTRPTRHLIRARWSASTTR